MATAVSEQDKLCIKDLSKIRRQVEFYFSDRNLSRDWQLRAAADGVWLSATWILQCPKLRREGVSLPELIDALQESDQLVFDDEALRVRRKEELGDWPCLRLPSRPGGTVLLLRRNMQDLDSPQGDSVSRSSQSSTCAEQELESCKEVEMQESSTRADKAPQDCGEAKPPQEEMRTEKDHDQAVEVDDTLRSEGLGELSELQDADANDTREEVQDNNAGSAQDHDNDENHAIEPGGGSQWQVPEEDRDNEEETAEELLLCSGRKDHDKQVKTVEGLRTLARSALRGLEIPKEAICGMSEPNSFAEIVVALHPFPGDSKLDAIAPPGWIGRSLFGAQRAKALRLLPKRVRRELLEGPNGKGR
ncbi:HTH La-type RNA-binding domain-containing protein, partial [Durusdinium trenchii]